MSRHGHLTAIRLALDEAITYGTKKESLEICRKGLALAHEKRLAGEEEYFRGQADLIHERFASAIEHFDAAIRHNPLDGAAYNDRALCMVELGIIDAAMQYFDKGISVEPDFATIHHNKGWLLNNIGRHTEAVRCFEQALALEPRRAVTYDNLADARFNLGDIRGSLEAYQKVLELLPSKSRGIRKSILARIKEITLSQENK